MKKYKATIIVLAIVVVATVGIICVDQFLYVEKAHSTFENYYAFRGCTELLERTDSYGICKTGSGQTIKIVLF
ncbi:MAG: hypothetical protein KGJ35_02965, partial [Patescibacteria group bacterium]|nr:hypothetical protein [Patescibacteria group bacterium]